jgi:hypothetical protein
VLVRWVLSHLWTPVGAGVKTQEEVDALAMYLFGDGPEGREQVREIDATVSALPGLGGLRIVETYLDAALVRVAERPGWAGIAPVSAPARSNGHSPAPTHWAAAGARED